MTDITFTEIAERLKKTKFPPVDMVVGIGTGGIVPASLVAFQLDKELAVITLNFRDLTNTPIHESPLVLSEPDAVTAGKKILLVDDVSVTGSTLKKAIEILNNPDVVTFTLKGRADIVLFPEIKDCVKWPWKDEPENPNKR